MNMPGFTAERSFNKTRAHYRTASSSIYRDGIYPALGWDPCYRCQEQGQDCKKNCYDCGPFDWFTCCDFECVDSIWASTRPPVMLKG